MNRIVTLGTAAVVLCTGASAVFAGDARSIALGGAVIASGKGVHGALSNPASMMAMQRRGETTHLRLGLSAELRDSGDLQDTIDTITADENDDLIDDIEDEIDTLSGQQITCDPRFDSDDTDCITGTQELSDIAGRILDILDLVDDRELEAYAEANLGMAYTKTKVPFAINLGERVTGFATTNVDDADRTYVSDLNTLLDDDSLTLGEIEQANFIQVQPEQPNDPLLVQQPEDVLQSQGSGGYVARTQLGVSLAQTVTIAGNAVDIGITPKLSSLTARSVDVTLSEEFDDDTVAASDRFEDSEETESSFTVDLGATVMLRQAPIRVAAVIYNLIPESVKTKDGVEFETTAQFVVGAQYQRGLFSFSGDLALNEAEQDSFKTQKMGVGVEFGNRLLSARAGIAHDAARTDDATSLTLGFGLYALDFGARLTNTEGLEAGMQLSFSFM